MWAFYDWESHAVDVKAGSKQSQFVDDQVTHLGYLVTGKTLT